MADDKKTKKKKEKTEPPPNEPPAPASTPVSSVKKTPSSRKVKKGGGGSNVFDMFSQKQVAEFKEGFQMMDRDKDGVIGKEDLRGTFDDVGKMTNEAELESMLADAPHPINFTMLLQMFAQREGSGGSDDDDVVAAAFKAFDQGDGFIDADAFRHALMTWGDRYSEQEANDAFEQFEVDENGKMDCNHAVAMLTGKLNDEGTVEAAA